MNHRPILKEVLMPVLSPSTLLRINSVEGLIDVN